MARPNDNERFNLAFSEDLAQTKIRQELLIDAINVMDAAMRGTFELLTDQGLLPPGAAGVKQYQKAMAELRRLGLPSEAPKGTAQTECPGCHAMLRIAGARGERCQWCGHSF